MLLDTRAEHFTRHHDAAAAARIAAVLQRNRERATSLRDIMGDQRTLTTTES